MSMSIIYLQKESKPESRDAYFRGSSDFNTFYKLAGLKVDYQFVKTMILIYNSELILISDPIPGRNQSKL